MGERERKREAEAENFVVGQSRAMAVGRRSLNQNFPGYLCHFRLLCVELSSVPEKLVSHFADFV